MQIDPAYIAGYLDGEGSFGINNGSSIRVAVTNTYRPILEKLAAAFGGRVSPRRHRDPNARPAYEYKVYGKKAENLLRMVLPHLQEKLTQAALCIEFQDTEVGSQRRAEILAALPRLKRPQYWPDRTMTYGDA